MIEKFKTSFFVRSSLISLYLALTIPIPFISVEKLIIPSFIAFHLGLFVIIDITSDYVETSDLKILYKVGLISKILGKQNWEILWKDIKLIKSLRTSQRSKVYYFFTNKDQNFLIPQRIEKFDEFKRIVSKKTSFGVDELGYLSPIWTYKLLTLFALIMIFWEGYAFLI